MGNHWTIIFHHIIIILMLDIFWKHYIYYKKDTKFGSQILATKFGFVPDCFNGLGINSNWKYSIYIINDKIQIFPFKNCSWTLQWCHMSIIASHIIGNSTVLKLVKANNKENIKGPVMIYINDFSNILIWRKQTSNLISELNSKHLTGVPWC